MTISSFTMYTTVAALPGFGEAGLSSQLLLLGIVLPLVVGLALFFSGKLPEKAVKMIAGIGFLIPAIISILLACGFAAADKVSGYAYLASTDLGLGFLGINLTLGLNGLALPLYVLAGVVGLAAGLQAIASPADKIHQYLALLLVMQAGLMGVFASVDIFFFYFFHEFALIPTFVMMAMWGGRGRRSAAMEMAVYLTLGAMLSLAGIIALYIQSGATSFSLIALKEYVASPDFEIGAANTIFGLLLFGFGILVSLFPFHSWAPRTYSTAPTAAAMLHAGVLKKFGLYGLIQIAAPLLASGFEAWLEVLVWLALGNVIIIGFVTMGQRDLKQMVGYSSVMHMGYAFLGIAAWSVIGLSGAIIMMFAHGLSVALMLMLSTCVYNRARTFDMEAMGGLGTKTPVLASFFVAATMASIGLPGFANFWGEFAIFVALWELSPAYLVPAVAGIVISAVYGLRATARIFYGPETTALAKNTEGVEVKDLSWSEKLPALVLLVALFAIGIYPSLISKSVDSSVQELLESTPAATQVEATVSITSVQQ